ncbi:rhodanese-like domain-containing protein [Labilibaculum antarcticum]|uniref:Rhodanese-like domain-containing protein n=1 Tax=Labilibaculum antarcticum TaxID=1717717 RepID=A0A1Y1CJD6_9BACT|nr:rhodanese-like domain-containing protein [Labilibaculum antarcticum]BAX80193.1 rhodanese-like domain-containing protein [Labilibaculum antarcticum]
MKSLLTFIALFLTIGTTSVFSQTDTVQILSPNHFNQVLQLNPDVELIDVSSKKEFKKGHIKGARLAQNSEDLYRLIDSLGTSKVYLLYCKYGERSIDAGKIIYEKYKISVCSLEGGLDAWLQSGFGME